MGSTRGEENGYSTIDYDCPAVEQESANLTSRSQLRSSEGNTYEEPSSAVKKREEKTAKELGEMQPFVKKEKGENQNLRKSTCCTKVSIITYGLLILFILLTCALALLLYFQYLELEKFQTNTSNSTQPVEEQERIINDQNATIDRLVDQISKHGILMDTISNQNKTISEKEEAIQRHLAELKQEKNNVSELLQTIEEQKKQIGHQAADLRKLENNSSKLLEINEQQTQTIARQSTDINRLKNKINELAPEHTSVMLTGGWIGRGITTSTAIYNSAEKNWTTCKLTLPHKLANHGAAVLNNEIYILGGYADGVGDNPFNTVYKMGANNTWEEMAPMIEKRGSIPRSSVVFNSEIWVIGGWNGKDALKSVEKYNPKTDSWTKMPELVVPRASAGAAVIDGKIYISSSSRGQKNSVEVYDPEKNTWEIFSTMPQEMHIHTLTGNHSQLIVNGEWKMDVLDPKRKWEEMPSLQQKRTNTGAAKITDRLMVFGGAISHSQRIDSVEIFDGIKWNEGPKLLEKRGVFAYFPLTCAQERLFLKQYCS